MLTNGMYYVGHAGALIGNGWRENYSLITAVISQMVVTVVSVADVACANTQTAASAVLALEIGNEFLINTKREGSNVVEETNKHISGNVISLNMNSNHLQGSLEKAAGKLCAKFSKAKGGAERKKIKGSKTRIVLQSDDVVDVGAVQDELQQTEVRCTNNKWWYKNDYVHVILGGPS